MRYDHLLIIGSTSSDENESASSVRGKLSILSVLVLLNLFSCSSGLCFKYIPINSWKYLLSGLFILLSIAVTIYIAVSFNEIPKTTPVCSSDGTQARDHRFHTPLVPYLPALGIYVNWFLMAHIGLTGMVLLVAYVLVGLIILYGMLSLGNSVGSDTCNCLEAGSVTEVRKALLE